MEIASQALADAVYNLLTNPLDLMSAPLILSVGAIWYEEDDGWLLPWRITGCRYAEAGSFARRSYREVAGRCVMQGYPCGEPRRI